MSIGQQIRKLRKEKKISQEKLALALGIDQSGLSKVELGKKDPTLTQQKKLSEFLNGRCSF